MKRIYHSERKAVVRWIHPVMVISSIGAFKRDSHSMCFTTVQPSRNGFPRIRRVYTQGEYPILAIGIRAKNFTHDPRGIMWLLCGKGEHKKILSGPVYSTRMHFNVGGVVASPRSLETSMLRENYAFKITSNPVFDWARSSFRSRRKRTPGVSSVDFVFVVRDAWRLSAVRRKQGVQPTDGL